MAKKIEIQILSTRPVDPELIDEAALQGLQIDVVSFITTEPIQSIEVQQEIEQALLQSATVVFTSMNAVEAVAVYMTDDLPDWSIYCIGEATRKLVKEYFGDKSLAGTADDAAMLADLIIEEGETDEVIFFCGDQRRDELPDMLSSADIEVTEIVVYQTVPLPQVIKKFYNGILFFSPSAVESFFSVNKLKEGTVLFAIGLTTAKSIKKYSANTVVVAERPGKEYLVEQAISYFTGKIR